MADIKQAAKWMQDGKTVRRSDEPHRLWRNDGNGWLEIRGTGSDHLWRKEQWHNNDLLSDDWEIAE